MDQIESYSQPTEADDNRMQSLSEMPSWDEHIKTFEDAKNNNEIPAGVRDEQDYAEYNQELEARLKEAKDFMYEHFGQCIDSDGDTKVDSYVNIPTFEAFARSGLSLTTLLNKGIISVKSPDTGSNLAPDPWGKDLLLEDVSDIIADIGALFLYKERNEDYGTFDSLKATIEKWDNPSELTRDDITHIISGTEKGTLERRLLFGNPFTEDDSSLVNHTTKTLAYITEGGYDTDTNVDIVKEIDWSLKEHVLGTSSQLKNREYQTGTENKIKGAIGKAIRARIDDFVEDYKNCDKNYRLLDRDEVGQLIFSSVGLKDICELGGGDIPESSLIEAVFYSDQKDNVYKEHDGRNFYNAWTLPQYVGRLLESGFKKNTLIEAMHNLNKDIIVEPIHNGIGKMRDAGLTDADIAYSLHAYEYYYPGSDENDDENDPPKWDIKEYEDADFSDKDLLKAALRDINSRI